MADSNELLQFLKTVDRDVKFHLPNYINEEENNVNQAKADSSSSVQVQKPNENISLNNSCVTQTTSDANDDSKKSRLVKPEHICPVCNKAFKRRDHFKEHYLIHTGERPHTCHICQKSFKRRSSLTAHLMTHQDIRPYVCLVCNKSFKTASKLNVHGRSHPVDQQKKIQIAIENKKILGIELECNECGLKFTCSQDLNLHYKIHNNKNVNKNTQVESKLHNKSDFSITNSDMEVNHSNSDLHITEDEHQKNVLCDAVKMQVSEDFNMGDYEEWSKHFHMGGADSDNEDDISATEEKDMLYKDVDGSAIPYQHDFPKTRNSGFVEYSLHRTKILNFPDY